MYQEILKRAKKVQDGATEIGKDGKETNSRLHYELVEGVDDTDEMKRARKALKGKLTDKELDLIYPVK